MAVLSRSLPKNKRRGAILVLGAIASVLMVAFMAFAVDLGYLFVARTELQRSADAAAIASAWRLLDESRFGGDEAFAAVQTAAREAAAQYAGSNDVCSTSPSVDFNASNNPNGDIVFGRLMDGGNMSTYGNPAKHNAVRVLVRRSEERNGEVPLFFARFLGFDSSEVTAQATATFGDGVTGFRPTERTGNTTLIPFAIQVDYWEEILASSSGDDAEGAGEDLWEFDLETERVWPGSDGIREITIYPNATGSSGNFGTLEIGNPNNGVSELSDQIADGISKADLDYQGGELGLGPCNGDPGISGGIKHGLREALGKARSIALYDTVSGGGNNCVYNLVGFAGIRVMDYWFEDDSDNRIVVQAAVVIDDSAISGSGRSYGVYQPVVLAQ